MTQAIGLSSFPLHKCVCVCIYVCAYEILKKDYSSHLYKSSHDLNMTQHVKSLLSVLFFTYYRDWDIRLTVARINFVMETKTWDDSYQIWSS